MAELTVTSDEKNGAVVLYPDGFINAHTVQAFEKAVQSLVEKQVYHIVINCNGLSYINSSGLGVLMGVIEEIQENKGFLLLSNMNETVFNIFDTLGFTHLFKVFDTEDEAISAIKDQKNEEQTHE